MIEHFKQTTFNKNAFSTIRNTWTYQYLIVPFVCTRLALVMAAWFASNFFQNLGYPEFIQRGFVMSPVFLLDIWTRWDSNFYLSIIKSGYMSVNPAGASFTNLPFFPLYPYLVKLISLAIPGAFISQSVYLLIGVILSNLFFLGGILLLRNLIAKYFGSGEIVNRTIILIFVFPTSFVFSCFYAESLFFFLSVASFSLACRRKWLFAGITSALLAVTKPQGILILVPLVWMYMESCHWRIGEIKLDLLPLLGLPPLILAAHFYNLYIITGNPLAPVIAQQAWGRNLTNVWQQFVSLFISEQTKVARIDSILLLIFVFLSVYALFQLKPRFWGIFALCMLFLPLVTGSYISISRHLLVIFPCFVALAVLLRGRELFGLVTILFFTLQISFMIGWANYYWIA